MFSPTDTGIHGAELTGLALFALSEIIGMSKFRENSVLQVLIRVLQDAFPYEVKRRQENALPSRSRPVERGLLSITRLFSRRP